MLIRTIVHCQQTMIPNDKKLTQRWTDLVIIIVDYSQVFASRDKRHLVYDNANDENNRN